jgi:hypothetical protein
MNLATLTAEARHHLPWAEQIRIEKDIIGRAPYKLFVTHNGQTHWTPFAGHDLLLACKVIASRLQLGVNQTARRP